MSHRIVLTRLMEVGAGASGQLARVLQELGCSRPLIVTDRMMVELGYVARIAGQLEEAGIASQCFADTLPEPTAASIRAGVEMVRQGDFDSIVALGGGSPIGPDAHGSRPTQLVDGHRVRRPAWIPRHRAVQHARVRARVSGRNCRS